MARSKWMTVEEAAVRLGLTMPDVLAMVRGRRIAGVLADGTWSVSRAEVDALLVTAAAKSEGVGQVANALHQKFRVLGINLDEYEIEQEVIRLVSRDVCAKHKIIPVSRAGSSITVAMADPTNLHAIDDIKFLTGFDVEPVVSSETAILTAVEHYYGPRK